MGHPETIVRGLSCDGGGGGGWAWLPGGAAFFPLIVGDLFEVGAVVAHDEDFAVRLGGHGVERFVFESHAGAGEEEAFAVGGPGEVGFVAGGVGELLEVFAIGVDGEDFKVAVDLADEGDEVFAWGPDGEVVVVGGEGGGGLVGEVEDAEAFALRAGGAVDDVFTVGCEGWKAVVIGAGGDEVEAGSVGVDEGDLCSSVDGVGGLLATAGEVEEGGEATDAEDDLAAIWGPLGGEHELLVVEDGVGWVAFGDDFEAAGVVRVDGGGGEACTGGIVGGQKGGSGYLKVGVGREERGWFRGARLGGARVDDVGVVGGPGGRVEVCACGTGFAAGVKDARGGGATAHVGELA